MPRPPRVFVPDGIYHVAAHASDRRTLFLDDRDRDAFLSRFAHVVERHRLACIAYCLMDTHYHLLVQTPDERLSKAQQELHTWYARQFNRSRRRRAHLFRARFMAELIDTDSYLLTACRYLARNPVQAELCEHPAEWSWSSYRATVGLASAAVSLTPDPLRAALGEADGWRARYRDFVESPRRTGSGPAQVHGRWRHGARPGRRSRLGERSDVVHTRAGVCPAPHTAARL